MTTIGDKQLLSTETLLLADDETGEFVVPIVGEEGSVAWPLRVKVRFTAPDAADGYARWEYDRGVLSIVFTGWADRDGTSFRQAKRLGDYKGVTFGFNVTHQRLGELNQVTFQFYAGGTYE